MPAVRARHNPTLAVVAAAMLAAALLLAHWGRGEWFGSDDLGYTVRLATQPLGHALLHPPPNKYLIAVPLLLYDGLLRTFGFESYVPYRVLGILLILLCAGLLFVLLRRRLPDRFAIPPMLLMLFFGAGAGVVLTPTRIPSQIALATGLGMLLALERRDRTGDLVGMMLPGGALRDLVVLHPPADPAVPGAKPCQRRLPVRAPVVGGAHRRRHRALRCPRRPCFPPAPGLDRRRSAARPHSPRGCGVLEAPPSHLLGSPGRTARADGDDAPLARGVPARPGRGALPLSRGLPPADRAGHPGGHPATSGLGDVGCLSRVGDQPLAQHRPPRRHRQGGARKLGSLPGGMVRRRDRGVEGPPRVPPRSSVPGRRRLPRGGSYLRRRWRLLARDPRRPLERDPLRR